MGAETLVLLPLEKRREDILPLAHHYLDKLHAEGRLRQPVRLCSKVERALVQRRYSANVGDLEHLLFRLALHESGPVISEETYARVAQDEDVSLIGGFGRLEEAERISIQEAVDAHHGDVKRAAELLGIDPQALRRRASKHGIEVGRRWRPAVEARH